MSSLVDTRYYTVILVTTTMLCFTLHITQDIHSQPALFVFWSAGTWYRLAEFSYQLPSNPANQAAGCCTFWTSARHIKGNKNLTPGRTASANALVFPALFSRAVGWNWQEILERRTLNYSEWIWQKRCPRSDCTG